MPAKKKSRRKSGATRKTEQRPFNFAWFVVTALACGFALFLVYLDDLPSPDGNQKDNQASQKTKASTKQSNKSQQQEHQFEFYTVLPDRKMDVTIDDEQPDDDQRVSDKTDSSKSTQPKTNISESKPAEKNTLAKKYIPGKMQLYQLQVGAFKELSKADSMKAKLAFMGVESNIQVISNKGQKMYRVRVGPSSDSQRIEKIQQRLKAKNINTFFQKLKG